MEIEIRLEELLNEIETIQQNMKEQYAVLGEKYYKQYGNNAASEFETETAVLSELEQKRTELEEEQQMLLGMTTCEKCGQMISKEHIFCPFCGTKRKILMKSRISGQGICCPYCGEPAAEDQLFCCKCGNRLEQEEGTVPVYSEKQETAAEEEQPYQVEQDWEETLKVTSALPPEDKTSFAEQIQTETAGRFCPNCHTPVEDDQIFCMECGAKL